jgi:hypothetical protein
MRSAMANATRLKPADNDPIWSAGTEPQRARPTMPDRQPPPRDPSPGIEREGVKASLYRILQSAGPPV